MIADEDFMSCEYRYRWSFAGHFGPQQSYAKRCGAQLDCNKEENNINNQKRNHKTS